MAFANKDILLVSGIIFLFAARPLFAGESSETFILTYDRERIKVVPAKQFKKKLSVIIKNDSLSDLKGKLILRNKEEHEAIVSTVAVGSGKNQSVEVQVREGFALFFHPDSPPSQAAPLIFGGESYSIPPEK